MVGYSGTPLYKKLGFKEGYRVQTFHAPSHYANLIAGLPDKVVFVEDAEPASLDLVHVFADQRVVLSHLLPIARKLIKPAGMIWVSWPKKASKVPTDVSEDVVRGEALPLGLVDVKVCAVDDVWSGLKVVIRKELR